MLPVSSAEGAAGRSSTPRVGRGEAAGIGRGVAAEAGDVMAGAGEADPSPRPRRAARKSSLLTGSGVGTGTAPAMAPGEGPRGGPPGDGRVWAGVEGRSLGGPRFTGGLAGLSMGPRPSGSGAGAGATVRAPPERSSPSPTAAPGQVHRPQASEQKPPSTMKLSSHCPKKAWRSHVIELPGGTLSVHSQPRTGRMSRVGASLHVHRPHVVSQ